MRILRCLLLLAGFATTGAPSVHAQVVVLHAGRDNTLFEDADGDTSNGAGPGLFCGRISQGRLRRALLAFELTGTVPPGAVIDSVQLRMHMASSSDLVPRTLSLHRVLAEWGEGASSSAGGGGAPARPGDATWLHAFYPTSLWSRAGGDFESTASAVTVVAGEGECSWRSQRLTDDVRGWLDGSSLNHGWLLKGDETASNTARRFDSRESATTAYRPQLIIHFSAPTPVKPATWGRVKSRYR